MQYCAPKTRFCIYQIMRHVRSLTRVLRLDGEESCKGRQQSSLEPRRGLPEMHESSSFRCVSVS
jgi:hypothetical protein